MNNNLVIKEKWNKMEAHLNTFVGCRSLIMNQAFSKRQTNIQYVKSFLRGPINDIPNGNNHQFLFIDKFTIDGVAEYVHSYYNLEDNNMIFHFRYPQSDNKDLYETLTNLNIKSLNLDDIKVACFMFNFVHEPLEDYVKHNLKVYNLKAGYPKLRCDANNSWHIDVICKWENNNDNSHLIIPLNDRYIPYFEKTFVPVERELFDTARTVQKELLNIIY